MSDVRTKVCGRVLLAVLAWSVPLAAEVRVKQAIADAMTSVELARYVAALADAQTSRAPVALPADTCTAAGYEAATLPFTGASDTTVGQTDDFDLPGDVTSPTCAAPTSCTGDGPAGSLPRGGVFTGTGTGPDRAYRIRVDESCTLAITATPESSWDLALVVYEATCSSSLADCACVDDTGLDGIAETVSLEAVAGADYFIVIDGYGMTPPGSSGPFHVGIAETTATGCQLVDPNPTTTSTSTTTVAPTTTTTLPGGGCGAVPIDSTFASLACRLDGAIAQVASLPAPSPKLAAALQKARTFEQAAADFCMAEHARKARKNLAKAARKVARAGRLIRKSATLDPAVQAQLVADASALVTDLRARRSALACPEDVL